MEPFRLYGSVHRVIVPSVKSFTLPATLPKVLLAKPWGWCDRCFRVRSRRPCRRETPPPSRLPMPIPADPCTVLRIALVLEPRVALTPESSQNPFPRMHVRYVA